MNNIDSPINRLLKFFVISKILNTWMYFIIPIFLDKLTRPYKQVYGVDV